MSDTTKIQWCDSTHNFWRGCTKVSAGCANCYAKKQVERFGGKFSERVRSKQFNLPLRWNKKPWVCDECGHFEEGLLTPEPQYWCGSCRDAIAKFHRRRVFSLSLGDIGDPEVPLDWFNDSMVIVDKCRSLQWILCTKRCEEFLSRWLKVCKHWGRTDTRIPENITILASVEDQQTADERIPHLLKIPAARRGLSIEPLLGPVDLSPWIITPMNHRMIDKPALPGFKPEIGWVIVGGESGPKARPCKIEWIRSIRDQCKAANVPLFIKQFGSNVFDEHRTIAWCGKYRAQGNAEYYGPVFKHPKGGDPAEWPEDLRVREFPNKIS